MRGALRTGDLLRLARTGAMAASLAALLAGLPAPLQAQNVPTGQIQSGAVDPTEAPAFLVADAVAVTDDNRLIADGNVEALYDGTRLWAKRIIYNQTTDTLEIIGPIRIDTGDGVVMLADSAALDSDLENGLLRGARVVLDQQLQLAAVQVARVEGRYSQLSKVTVTSCQICNRNAVPLWSIRARRAIHDQEEQQLYFDGAQLRILDIPVMYLPRLRLPDPTLKRARGFLFPTMRSTTELGTGIKIPYFLPLGKHADVTVTPYLSPETTTLELRFRKAFHNGDIEVNSAFTKDTLRPGEFRWYAFAEGTFDLPRDFKLSFDIEATSDKGYLSEYDYSGKDRLDSEIRVGRSRRNENLQMSLIHYNSLRDDEANSTAPTIIPDITYERRFQLAGGRGGELRLGAEGHGHYRSSEDDVVGRDVQRSTVEVTWLDEWTTYGGLQVAARAGLAFDQFYTADDSTVEEFTYGITPSAALTLRMPLLRTTTSGARQLLEPILQFGWIGGRNADVANDESTLLEFDDGNMLALSRFPAPDRRERGASVVGGMRFVHQDPRGWEAGLAVGRVYRETSHEDFTASSGLDHASSDWLLATHLRHDDGLYLISRTLISDEGEVSKSEARGSWSNGTIDLGAAFLLLPEDAEEDRNERVSEWSFDGSYRVNRHWTASANLRYDIADRRAVKTGLGLQYRNECVQADFSASRNFANSTDLDPSTTFGLTVRLKGFSTGGAAGGYSRTCTQ